MPPLSLTHTHPGAHPACTLTLSCQPWELGGGGAGALQADTRLFLPAPWGSLQMPEVILSLDQWTIFW